MDGYELVYTWGSTRRDSRGVGAVESIDNIYPFFISYFLFLMGKGKIRLFVVADYPS